MVFMVFNTHTMDFAVKILLQKLRKTLPNNTPEGGLRPTKKCPRGNIIYIYYIIDMIDDKYYIVETSREGWVW